MSMCLLSTKRPGVRRLSATLDAAAGSWAWSPDSTHFLVEVGVPGREIGKLMVMNAKRTHPRVLVEEGESGDWSPDGKKSSTTQRIRW